MKPCQSRTLGEQSEVRANSCGFWRNFDRTLPASQLLDPLDNWLSHRCPGFGPEQIAGAAGETRVLDGEDVQVCCHAPGKGLQDGRIEKANDSVSFSGFDPCHLHGKGA